VIISRKMRLAGHVACSGERRDANWVVVGKLEGRRVPETMGHRKEAFKISQRVKLEGPDWIDLLMIGTSVRLL
jgi:hypothetical protein